MAAILGASLTAENGPNDRVEPFPSLADEILVDRPVCLTGLPGIG